MWPHHRPPVPSPWAGTWSILSYHEAMRGWAAEILSLCECVCEHPQVLVWKVGWDMGSVEKRTWQSFCYTLDNK